ncbi:MAG: MerR family transcriptional regulator [Paenibacillaceae bacterium]
MRINELAERLGMTPRAIRLYEQKGLLQPERIPDNGYRNYSEEDSWRLQTIASLREIGLSILQIQVMLEKFDQGDSAEVHHYLEIQRMVMVAKWVEMKHAISHIDELISRSETKLGLQLDDLFQLAEQLRQLRQHSTWQDKWGFDRLANDYDQTAAQVAVGGYLTTQEYELTLALMTQWITPLRGEVGLDVGTGTGNLAGRLLSKGSTMYAIDQSNEMLTRCRAKLPYLSTKLGNALSIPYVDKQFHFLATAFAFHHLDEQQLLLALEEMNRVLKPNGRLCISGLMYDHSLSSNHPLIEQSDKYPTDQSKLISWLHEHDFITVQHQINEWIHVVYATKDKRLRLPLMDESDYR